MHVSVGVCRGQGISVSGAGDTGGLSLLAWKLGTELRPPVLEELCVLLTMVPSLQPSHLYLLRHGLSVEPRTLSLVY